MEIYRIAERETGEEVGAYMRPAARDEYNFKSVEAARNSNCHGIYKDKEKYKIRKYKLVLVDDDCDPPTEEEMELAKAEKEKKELLKQKFEKLAKVEVERNEIFEQKCEELSLKSFGKSYLELDCHQALTIYLACQIIDIRRRIQNELRK